VGYAATDARGSQFFQDYSVNIMCDGAHGAPLIPWPNLLGDGRYRFDGTDYQVALTEPDKQNAIHGLLRWQSWSVREHAANRLTMGVRLHPSPGYPFGLDVRIDYRLGRDGLTATTIATTPATGRAPTAVDSTPICRPATTPSSTTATYSYPPPPAS